MALSKDWTLKEVRGILRGLVNELAPEKVQDLEVDDFLHLAVCDVAEMLNEATIPDYGEKQTVTETSDAIDLSSYRIDTVLKLADDTNGLYVEVQPKSFENLANLPNKSNSIFWYRHGENIYLYKGEDVTAYGTTISLYYNRIPERATDDADYLDVRDKYMKLAIDKSKLLIYEQLQMAPPENLEQSVTARVQAVRESNKSELETIKNTK